MLKKIFHIFRKYPFGFFFCLAWLIFLYFKLPHLIWDPGIVFSYFLSNGYIFFKDFINFHFPLSTFLIFPFYIATNWNLHIEPLMSLITAILTLFILQITASKFLSSKGVFISLTFFSILFYYFTTAVQYNLESVIGLLIAFLFLLIFNLIKSNTLTPTTMILLGITISLAELFGQIVTLPLIAIFCLTVYIIWSKKTVRRDKLKKITFLIGGIMLPIIFILLYFLEENALGEFVYYNIIYYFTYLKLANGKGSITALPWGDIIAFYIPLLFSFILLLKTKSIPKDLLKKLRFLSFVSLTTIPTVIFSVFHPHHFLYALPILSLLAGLTFDIIIKLKSFPVKLIVVGTGIFFFYQLIFYITPWYFQKISLNKGLVIINDSGPQDSMYHAALWVKNNTPKNTKILVAGDGLFYFKSQRLPSVKYHVVLPWHYIPMEQSIPIIQNNRPDYWIIGEGYLERVSSPQGWNSPEITEFIQEELKKCYRQEITLADWYIWKKSCHS